MWSPGKQHKPALGLLALEEHFHEGRVEIYFILAVSGRAKIVQDGGPMLTISTRFLLNNIKARTQGYF